MPAMLIPDVNVLVNAHRPEGAHHEICRGWLQQNLVATEPVGFLDLVCSGFVRIVTNPRIFKVPSATAEALTFVEELLEGSAAELLGTDNRWWLNFCKLCDSSGAGGNLITDAHIAAVAKSHSGTVISLDSDFRKFATVKWLRPS